MKPLCFVCCLIGARVLVGAGGPPAFEVATVKSNTSGDGSQFIQRQPGGRITVTNFPLRQLIAWAYQLAPYQLVGGPSWLASARFDMLAKLDGNPEFPGPGAVGPNPIQLAMRTLLSERFQLRVHHESRQMDVYALVMVKPGVPGPALKPSTTDCSGQVRAGPRPGTPPPNNASSGIVPCGVLGNPGVIRFGGFPLSRLATVLGGQSGRTVLDRTGLAGNWEFELHFAAEQSGQSLDNLPASDPDAPSLFTALQEQLGLRLESTKGPVDVVVIDNVEQLTSQ